MQPNNLENNVNSTTINTPNTQNEKTKLSKKQIIGLIVMSIIAVGGVLFGIYGMNSQNAEIADLKTQVSDANERAAELETNVVAISTPDESVVEITDSGQQNPTIEHGIKHSIPVFIQDTQADMDFYVTNGQFDSCSIININPAIECSVSGLPDTDIYKMGTIYEGNGGSNEMIGFIMSDGSVYYAPIYSEASTINTNTELVAKKANINGFVRDIIGVNYIDPDTHYGHASTVFVMNDGSYIEYNNSMFE